MSRTGLRVALVETREQRERWDEFVARADDGSMSQCFWWAEPLERNGVTARGIACWDGDVQVGGAMLRSLPVPLVGGTITECVQGPLFVDWRPQWAEPVLAGIAEVARRSSSIAVSLQGCPRSDAAADLAAAMRRAGMKVTRSAGGREAVVPLEGRSLDEVVAGFHQGTRRAVRKGQSVEVRRVAGTEQLRRAHGTWLATAARKGFVSVRPWETAEPMLRHSIDAGLATVFASFAGEELLAAIYVTYVGSAATYIYGGYADGAERYRPNHVLHLEAIAVALERGSAGYNLGSLSIEGVDQFKLGFGALPVTRTDTVVWERRAALYGVTQRLRRQRVGPALEAFIRRRLAGRDAVSRAGSGTAL